MKIGMLTDVYKPVINGITNSISLCKREMEAAGHQVTVFTFGYQDHEDGETGVIRSPALPISDTGYHFSLLYSREARDRLKQMDILHAHHPFLSGRMATRYGRQYNIPVAFTNHTRYDLYAKAYLPVLPPGLTQIVLESFMPSFAALCDLIVAPSAGVERVMRDLGVTQPIHVIPNGIDVARFNTPVQRISKTDLSIPEDATVVVYCGRLAPEKNLDTLINAFRGAARAVPNSYLLVIGAGPAGDHLREMAGKGQRVHFVGAVPYEMVPAYLAMGDLFATASVTEVHPLSVIEAMAAGLPVLGVQSPGIEETVRDGVDGFLVENDLPAFCAMLVRLLTEPGRRAEMSGRARERSRLYDIRTTAAVLLSHYERIIKEFKTRQPKETVWQALAREVQQVLDE